MEGLEDVDKMKRTPAHVAAICGQGEVVDLFLQQGGQFSYIMCIVVCHDE